MLLRINISHTRGMGFARGARFKGSCWNMYTVGCSPDDINGLKGIDLASLEATFAIMNHFLARR